MVARHTGCLEFLDHIHDCRSVEYTRRSCSYYRGTTVVSVTSTGFISSSRVHRFPQKFCRNSLGSLAIFRSFPLENGQNSGVGLKTTGHRRCTDTSNPRQFGHGTSAELFAKLIGTGAEVPRHIGTDILLIQWHFHHKNVL